MKNILIISTSLLLFAACEKSDIQPYGQIGVGVDETGQVQVSASFGIYYQSGQGQQFFPGQGYPYPFGSEIGKTAMLAGPVSESPMGVNAQCIGYNNNVVSSTVLYPVLVALGGGLSRTILVTHEIHQAILFAQMDAGDWRRVRLNVVQLPVGECGGVVISASQPYYF